MPKDKPADYRSLVQDAWTRMHSHGRWPSHEWTIHGTTPAADDGELSVSLGFAWKNPEQEKSAWTSAARMVGEFSAEWERNSPERAKYLQVHHELENCLQTIGQSERSVTGAEDAIREAIHDGRDPSQHEHEAETYAKRVTILKGRINTLRAARRESWTVYRRARTLAVSAYVNQLRDGLRQRAKVVHEKLLAVIAEHVPELHALELEGYGIGGVELVLEPLDAPLHDPKADELPPPPKPKRRTRADWTEAERQGFYAGAPTYVG